MWLSKKMRPAQSTVDADLGVTTIAGSSVGVVTRGEVRDLPVYGPGRLRVDAGKWIGSAGDPGRPRR